MSSLDRALLTVPLTLWLVFSFDVHHWLRENVRDVSLSKSHPVNLFNQRWTWDDLHLLITSVKYLNVFEFTTTFIFLFIRKVLFHSYIHSTERRLIIK